MMAGRMDTVKLAIRDMNQPSDGNPIAGIDGDERPFDRGPGKSVPDIWIVHDIDPVIQGDERTSGDTGICSNRDYSQE